MKCLLFATVAAQGLLAAASVPSVIPAGDIATATNGASLAATTLVEGELRLAPGESEMTLLWEKWDGCGVVAVLSGSFSLHAGWGGGGALDPQQRAREGRALGGRLGR